MKRLADGVYLIAYSKNKTRIVKHSKKCWSIWQRGHGWTLILSRTASLASVSAVLRALDAEGSL